MRPTDLAHKLTSLASAIESAKNPSLSKTRMAVQKIAGDLEGFAVDPAQIITHLIAWQQAKYVIDICYRNFADRLRGPWRESLADHWYEHAEEERQSAYNLSMRIISLGGDPIHTGVEIPQCQSDPQAFMGILRDLETAAIEKGRLTVEMAGDSVSLKTFAEDIVLLDVQHYDDIQRWSQAITIMGDK